MLKALAQATSTPKPNNTDEALEAIDNSHGSADVVHFFSSSGGNAGLACATAAVSLNARATIVVPLITPERMVRKLKELGATVVQHGSVWAEADAYLREDVMVDARNDGETVVYVPPFDHPDLWQGAAGIVDEITQQMKDLVGDDDAGIDGVVCSVGGGGLFCGIMEGLERQGMAETKVIAVETLGADSLNQSLHQEKLVTLPGITSIAISLGATRVAKRAFELAQRRNVESIVVTDAWAAMGSVFFADQERMLVEAACGCSIATAYDSTLRGAVGKGDSDEDFKKRKVVIVVCGGSNITTVMLEGYREKYGPEVLSRIEGSW